MALFDVTLWDLLVMSSVANTCVLVHLLTNRVIEWLGPAVSGKSSMVRTLLDLHHKRPGLLATIVVEQVSLWVLILLCLVVLSYTSISLHPFSHQPLPYPVFLIRLILSASVARFAVIATRIALITDTDCSVGQSGYARLDFLYNVFSAVTNLVCLGYHENLLLSLSSSFMEVSSTPVGCCRLIELARKNVNSQSYRKTTLLTCALCFVFRVALPSLFLALAMSQESPLCMGDLPLAWFFISALFYIAFHILFLSQSIKRIQKSRKNQSIALASPCHSPSSATPFSINSPEMLSNEILKSKKNLDGTDQYPLKDFNYGLLRSYDNRNLCSANGSDEGNKMNVLKTKDVFKNSLLQKMTRSNDGEIMKKIMFHRKVCKGFERTSSQDVLLASSTDVSFKEDGEILSLHGIENLKEHDNENFKGEDCLLEDIKIDTNACCLSSPMSVESEEEEILGFITGNDLSLEKLQHSHNDSYDTQAVCFPQNNLSNIQSQIQLDEDLIHQGFQVSEGPREINEMYSDVNIKASAKADRSTNSERHKRLSNLDTPLSLSDSSFAQSLCHSSTDFSNVADTDSSTANLLSEP